MTEIRRHRESLRLSQQQFAHLLKVPEETYRAWDVGRRATPLATVQQARAIVEHGQHVPVPLHVLSAELRVHIRTLRAAARDGRLRPQFAGRSYFGHPVATATRAATRAFIRSSFGCSAHVLDIPPTLVEAPSDCASIIVGLRKRLRLTQAALARKIGAADKAVVYQWETGKRIPSPVFWTRLSQLTISKRPK